MTARERYEHQADPFRVRADRVKIWSDGCILSDRCPLKRARLMVKEGQAYVIDDDSIGLCDRETKDVPHAPGHLPA
jgi:hypothetical protein